jgi:hypothetical protein
VPGGARASPLRVLLGLGGEEAGQERGDGPLVETIEDKNELVAAGQAVAIIPGGLHDGSIRPDLTTVPLHGVEPGHGVLATRPMTAAAWSRPSAGPPRTASPVPSPPGRVLADKSQRNR